MKEDVRLEMINDLKNSINTEIEKRGIPNNIIDHLSNRALSDLHKRLQTIEEILSIEKYDLVFIGQVGVGKTTAICHLFQLILGSNKKKKIGKKEKEVHVIEELMATGSGFTTLCEVIVSQNDSTYIEIEPYSKEELKKITDDFCWSIWLKTYPNLIKDQKDQGSLPPELIRAVRNMVKLPPKEKRENDPAIKLASNYDSKSFDEFVAEVVKMANIEERNEIKLFPDKDTQNKKLWLKETFSNLNLAKIPSFSIPHRMHIYVEPSIISVENERIKAIVDTKGVDAKQFDRNDLDTYIRDKNDAICIFAENFLAAPSNVIDIIERHLTKDTLSKMVLCVMPRENQPENVVSSDGPIGDREKGIFLRCNQIEDVFNGRGINFPKENVLMYDPFEFYQEIGVDHRINPDFEQKDIDNERKRIFSEIAKIIKRREELIWDEVQEKEQIYLEIKEGRGLDPAEEQLIRDAKPKIEKYSLIDFVNADRFFDEYRRPWFESRHVMMLRATNNRYGQYPFRDIDICYDAKPVVEKLVRQLAFNRKEKLIDIVLEIRNKSSKDSELQRLMPILEERINNSFEKFVIESANDMKAHLENDIFYPQDDTNQFWLDVQDRFGKGSGYRDDVISMYQDQLDDYEKYLREKIENLWSKLVIDEILDFLG